MTGRHSPVRPRLRHPALAAVAAPSAGGAALLWGGVLVLALALAWPALGQTASPPVGSPTPGPTMPTSPGDAAGRPGGVIHPPAGIDPRIHAPAPDPTPGTTPVIPPPGAPGGDPGVQPR